MPWRTLISNLQLPFDLRNEEIEDCKLLETLDLLGLRSHATSKPSSVSGGQQQRLALGRAFITSPKILLLDEPFNALDVRQRYALGESLQSMWLAEKPDVMLVTHNVEDAVYHSDRILVLQSWEKGNSIKDVITNNESRP